VSVLYLCTEFEFLIRIPIGRCDTISVLAVIGLVTLTFELLILKLVLLTAHGVRNLGTVPILVFLGLFVLK